MKLHGHIIFDFKTFTVGESNNILNRGLRLFNCCPIEYVSTGYVNNGSTDSFLATTQIGPKVP